MTIHRLAAAVLGIGLLAAPTLVRAEEITIGFTAALSGDFAAFGLNMRKGLDLAVEELNKKGGTTYTIDAVDDRGEAREGVLIAQRFCSDTNVDVVMGYSFSSIALAAIPVFNECKLPVLASAVTSPALSDVSPYFRRNVLTDAVQGAMMGAYAAKTLGLKQIYVLNQQDDYGIGVAKAFSDAAAKDGATILGTESYLLGTKDFRTLLTKVRAARPDAIFIGGFYTEAAKIAEQARALGIKAQLLSTDGALNVELMKLGRGAVEGMIVYGMFDPAVATPATEAFLSAYKAAHKEDPSAWAALGYDAGMALGAAVDLAAKDGPVTRESLNAAFGRLKDVPGVTGPTTFDASGDRAGALYFLEVKDGKFGLAPKQP
ncbi:ABC transporter substrate-binding protein [Ancylobacter dichloromethanicus]|uniref:Branched-chain amino acid ABC transporter substrate-binding protein n=1 Tax=Ancylobacter dichloromethanicus TaxID=518825 RepID=A0A9W6MZI2_9HYPH|nr:ABC transporter substrate-binding protein [Ancylobacter dichloromethanicus]MBS7552767.1 ABC transporter substrate-binding protein [Ancylobacter dichloromethanicus]GLK72131.1 branched-chain amino acid ABC transporter substrate-binding protein [Ancylobacter dichloromethanicus]